MSLLKNKVFVLFITLAILASGLAFAQTASAITLGELVELFISLGIIPSDKADAARATLISPTPPPSSCLNLKYNHYLGRRDNETSGEVSKLQRFLQQTGDYTYGEITGYFGPSTERAVQSWQRNNGVVSSGDPDTTGYGVVGPKTRDVMGCGGTTSPPPHIIDIDPIPIACPLLSPPPCLNGTLVGLGTDSRGCKLPPRCQPTNTGAPVVNGVKGPTSLNAGQQGTWAVIALVPNNPGLQLSYSVRWGDEELYPTSASSIAYPPPIQSSATFTHTYQRAGTYQPTFTVSNSSGSSQTSMTVQVGDAQPKSTITVTAPNGGEQWEIGKLNTITWEPYNPNSQINHSKDVTAYLETLDGGRVGKIMDQGKASLHTYFNINSYDVFAEPGQYYVRVVNNVTGVSDRSDAPFTLLPRSVDMKINGSDGFISVNAGEQVNVSWATKNVHSCQLSNLYPRRGDKQPVGIVSSSGSMFAYVIDAPGVEMSATLSCVGNDGNRRWDSVRIKVGDVVSTSASLQVANPNGGELLWLDKVQDIEWKQTGLNQLSIALYKNDQWLLWIDKDVGPDSLALNHLNWNPVQYPELNNAISSGNVFKIYITGQKADGTGYVDDKSDAPFGFINLSEPLGTYKGYMNGNLFITTQNITRADSLANCKLNHNSNPTASVRCTWGGIEIYNQSPQKTQPQPQPQTETTTCDYRDDTCGLQEFRLDDNYDPAAAPSATQQAAVVTAFMQLLKSLGIEVGN